MRQNEPLRVFVDPSWRRSNLSHVPLLFPFWGSAISENLVFTRRVFELRTFDTSAYRLVDDVSECEVVLVPYRYDVVQSRVHDVLHAARVTAHTAGKPLLIDAVGDTHADIREQNPIILRYGGYRFLKRDEEITIPPYSEDLLEEYCGGELVVTRKRPRPIVSFAGWTKISQYQYLRSCLKELPLRAHAIVDPRYRACRKGVFVRREALAAFAGKKSVDTSFLERSGYSGNLKTVPGDRDTIRNEFIANAREADIGLDIRGDANASTRLFELLSLGRVPAIIDTERNFPFSDSLDYRTFALIIDYTDISRAPEMIRTWYEKLSEKEWEEMQQRARAAYVEWFRIDSMTRHLVAEIRSKIRRF